MPPSDEDNNVSEGAHERASEDPAKPERGQFDDLFTGKRLDRPEAEEDGRESPSSAPEAEPAGEPGEAPLAEAEEPSNGDGASLEEPAGSEGDEAEEPSRGDDFDDRDTASVSADPGAEPGDEPSPEAEEDLEGLTGAALAKAQARQRGDERKAKRASRREARKRRLKARFDRFRGYEPVPAPEDRLRAGPEDGPPKPKLKKLRLALVTLGLMLLALVSWVFGVMMAVAQDLPSLEARAQYEKAANSVVYANDGKTELTTLTGNEKRILVDSEDISPLIKQAVVAIEDERFYEHRGVDYLGIARALQQDIVSGGAVQGASTITQQFVKNALEAQGSRTVLQKLREAAIAYQIERQWSKDKILTNYLNNIYFGHGAYGIEAAAKTYFGYEHPGCGGEGDRCASVLLPEEAAMLAALISSPTAYDPATNPEAAKSQRNVVLQKMRDQGVLEVSDEDFQAMLDSNVPIASHIETPTDDSKAPYFTDWLRQQIVDKYGPGRAFGGGLKITSSLDLDLQKAAEQAVDNHLSGVGPTSAVVAIDNGTGEVLAMVGGQNFNKAPFNLATNGQRQPGSSFKPFTLVTALKQGRSPDEVFPSQPVAIPFKATIRTKNGKKKTVTDKFRVSNYDDNYLGSASIRTATTYSDNSVYAQLGTQVGIKHIVDTAHDLGISSKLDDNPALILGGLEHGVTPLEMAYAYNTLANDGTRISGTEASRGNGKGPVAIKSVTAEEDGDQKPVPDDDGGSGENEKVEDQVLDPGVAGTTKDILRTVVTSGTGKRAQVGDDYVWGKTGTTDNNADAWFVGANEDITVAVWVGYPDGATPMETEFGGLPVDGGTIPALIWHDVVTSWDSIAAGRKADKNADSSSDDSGSVAPVSPTPTGTTATPPVTPTEPAPVAPTTPPETPATPPAAPTDPAGGGADPGTGGAVPTG
ncbi:MAG: transglycosylase domain-containing protein [Thermoleophilales bacterium]|nr:transglycosylase domain-containing protein [Thermoleophilales bacterium]